VTDVTTRLKNIEKNYKLHDFPPSVIVESTLYCNYNCIQCGHSQLTRPKGNMDINLYKKIVDEVAVESPSSEFWLAFYGEPLLLKYKLYYMIKYAKDSGLENVIINTNGMLLTDEMADLLIESGLDRMVLGIDGFSKETYEKIRLNGNKEQVYKNVLNMVRKIQSNQLAKPTIEVQFIIMGENQHELEMFKRFWTQQGVCLKIRDRVTWLGAVEKGSNIQDNIDRVACGWGVATCPITWQGEVVTCGVDYNAYGSFGNVREKSIKEIWNSPRREFTLKHLQHRFDELPKYCQDCKDWQVIGAEYYDNKGNKVEKVYK